MGRWERLHAQDRGNVLLAAAMMLAALVVLAALGLVLAPTGSDGVTDGSADDGEFDVLERGLQAVVFVESNDTLEPGYSPAFTPLDADGPAPIDNRTIAELLAPEPFTDEQVVQIQSLLTSLAYRSMGGDIAALEPVAGDTETGVLVRLGNTGPHDFGGTNTTIVENATALRDVELVFERTTLPTAPENATVVHLGNWTVAAHREAGRVQYQLGEYDPGAEWSQTDPGENLHLNAHERTINGEQSNGEFDFEVGEPPLEVRVVDTNRSDGRTAGTYGGLNLVAVGAGGEDVRRGMLSNRTDWQEVVTRPVFNATYLDSSTTLDTRIAVDTEYTYFEYDDEASGPFLQSLFVDVESEDPATLDGDIPSGDIWLPDYPLESVGYELGVSGVYSNGSTVDLTEAANFTVYNRTETGLQPCDDDCVETFDQTAIGEGVQAVPHTLTDVQVRATLPGLDSNTTVRENLSVVDPFVGTELVFSNDTVAVDQSVGSGATFRLVPRKKGQDDLNIDLPDEDVSEVTSLPAPHISTGMANRWNAGSNPEAVTGLFTALSGLNSAERTAFRTGSVSDQQAVLAQQDSFEDGISPAVASILSHFHTDESTPFIDPLTPSTLLKGPVVDPIERERGPHSALGVVYRGHEDIDIETTQQFAQLATTAGPGFPQGRLPYLTTDEHTLVHDTVVTGLIRILEWEKKPDESQQAATTLLQYNGVYEAQLAPGETLAGTELTDGQLAEASAIVAAKQDTTIGADALQDYAEQFWDDLRGAFFNPKPGVSESELAAYAWFAGVDDPQEWTDMYETVQAVESGLDRSSGMLLDAAQYRLLEQTALELGESGTFTLDSLDELKHDWRVDMRASHTGYEFANYTARDPVTVTDPLSGVRDIEIAVDHTPTARTVTDRIPADDAIRQTTNSTWQDNIDVPGASEYPVLVGEETPIEITLVYENGTTETNPDISRDFVEYSLVGPTYDAVEGCSGTYTWMCDPPESPSQFGSFSDSAHAFTATAATGTLTCNNYSAQTNACTDPYTTGPLNITATIPELGVTASTTTAAAELNVDGFWRWGPYDTRGMFNPELYGKGAKPENAGNLSAYNTAVSVGIQYTLRGTPNKNLSTPLASVTSGRHYVGLNETDWNSIDIGNESLVKLRTDPPVGLFEPMTLSVTSKSTGYKSFPTTVSGLDESAALNLSGSTVVSDEVTGGNFYFINGDTDLGGGGGGGSLPDGTEEFSVVASAEPDGTIVSNFPATTRLNSQEEVNETVDPDVSRFSYNDASAPDAYGKLVGLGYEMTAGQTEEDIYAWSNAGALPVVSATEHTRTDLEDGAVAWRDEQGCANIGGCLSTATGLVDYLNSAEDSPVGWFSRLKATAENYEGLFRIDSGGGGAGRHSYENFTVNANPTDGQNVSNTTVSGQLIIKGTLTYSEQGAPKKYESTDTTAVPLDVFVPANNSNDTTSDPKTPDFTIQSFDAPEEHTGQDDYTVTATVKNEEDTSGTLTAALDVTAPTGPYESRIKEVNLSAKATVNLTFGIPGLPSFAEGTVTVTNKLTLSGDDDGNTETDDKETTLKP